MQPEAPREENKVIEVLADLEHQQWAHSTRYMLDHLDHLTPENIERWRRQCDTPYAELSEKEKESHREWARKAFAVIPRVVAGPSALILALETMRRLIDSIQGLSGTINESLQEGKQERRQLDGLSLREKLQLCEDHALCRLLDRELDADRFGSAAGDLSSMTATLSLLGKTDEQILSVLRDLMGKAKHLAGLLQGSEFGKKQDPAADYLGEGLYLHQRLRLFERAGSEGKRAHEAGVALSRWANRPEFHSIWMPRQIEMDAAWIAASEEN